MATWSSLDSGATEGAFRANLNNDPEIAGRISPTVLDEAMDAKRHLRAVDTIFTRVFGEPGPAP
jgi:adenylosuccinate lyase